MKLYDELKITFIVFQDEDIVTLSGGQENFGTNFGDGEVGGEDIFN